MRSWLPALLVFALTACDPCSGVISCGESWIRYEGDLVMLTDEPAESMRVEFVRTEGIGIDSPLLSVRPDAQGRFRLDARTTGPGELIGDLLICSGRIGLPDRIEGVRLGTTPVRGNVQYLGHWRVIGLVFGAHGQLFYRAGNRPAVGVEVEFRRVAGIPLDPDTFVVSTDQNALFPLRPRPLAAGEVVFDLIVHTPAPYRPDTISGLRLSTRFTEQQEPMAGVWRIGPYFPQFGRLVWGDTGRPAAGVEIEFRRTGGIPVDPESLVTRSDETGHFSIGTIVPLGYGELVGELIVRPPVPYRSFTIPQLRLQTMEEDVEDTIVMGTWQIPRQ